MRKLSLIVLAAVLAMTLAAGTAYAGSKPTIGKPCVQCHKGKADVVRGTIGTRSEKFSTINIKVGKIMWVIKYDDSTTVKGAKSLGAIKKGKEIAVTFTGDVKTARAASISVKQPYKLPEGQVASVQYMKEIVAKGPEKGGYLLIDARPGKRYLEGHIPGAVLMAYAAFDEKHAQVLPKDKDKLVIFYCGGVT